MTEKRERRNAEMEGKENRTQGKKLRKLQGRKRGRRERWQDRNWDNVDEDALLSNE